MAGKKSKVSSPNSGKEPERLLPIANVSRIMKKSLPATAKISKEAKETVQECVSEFISFITGEAADKCHREKRKTINGDDLLWAMTTLGFHDYVGPLKLYLSKYREIEGDSNSTPKQDQDQDPRILNNGGSVFSSHSPVELESHGFHSLAKPFHLVGIGIGDADGGRALAPQLHQW